MEPAILQHSSAKIVGFTATGLAVAALGGFVAALPPDSDYHGRGAWLVDLVGPDGMRWLMIALAVGGVAVALASLRLLLSGNRVAACADADGITLHTMWGLKRFRWDEVADVRLKAVEAGARTQYLLMIHGDGRRNAGVSAGTIAGGRAAIERWIEQTATLHRSLAR